MSADLGLGSLFKSAMDGGTALLDLDDRDADALDFDEVSELEAFSPERVDGVREPANGAPALLLKAVGAQPQCAVTARMVKSQPERRFGLYVAYPSNKPDTDVAADGFRDFAGPDAVEEAAWSFMRKGQAIGLGHMPGTDGAGVCVESSVYRGPDWHVTAADGSQQVIKAGDWLVGIIWTPEAWELVKSGVINGVSMQGSAVRRKPSPEALAGLRKKTGGKRVAKRAQKAARAALDEQIDRALAELIVERETELRAKVVNLREQMQGLEKHRGNDDVEGRWHIAKGRGVTEVATALQKVRNGASWGGPAKAGKAPKVGKAPKAGPRCGSCGRFAKAADAHFCTKCGAQFGVAKAGAAPVPLSDGERLHAAALVAKAQSEDPERRLAGIGELVEKVGPEIAARIVAGELISPSQFARAFIARNRAPLSAPAGSTGPRIPNATHVITSDDFRRPPLADRQQRHLTPLESLQQAGQMGVYRAGAGIAPSDPYVDAPNSSTVHPGLARARSMQAAFAHPPAPGDARPW